jgi:hypothetical protein
LRIKEFAAKRRERNEKYFWSAFFGYFRGQIKLISGNRRFELNGSGRK